ncbi:MAG TPA: hypothetical protein VF188_08245 [Longimicrobiales bacterium]
MARDQAFIDGYGGIELELPNGRVLRRPAPALAEGARLLRTLMLAEAGDGLALLQVIEQFPAAIDAEKELEGLTPAEVVEVARRFLSHRRDPLRSPATMATARSSTRG